MKILYVSPEVPALGGAGIATYLDEATRALAAAGHECHILSWHAGAAQTLEQPGHTLHLVPQNDGASQPFAGLDGDLRIAKMLSERALSLHRQHHFDIIEGTDWCAPLYCLLQARRVEPLLRGTVVSVFNHGTTYNIARFQRSFTPREVYQRINLEHQCFRLADVVICPSEAARKSIEDVHDAPGERIEIIPEPMAWTEPTDPPASAKRILFFGSVSASKGIFEFVAVANRLLAVDPSLDVEIIGPVHANGQDVEAFKADVVRRIQTTPEKIAFSGAVKREHAIAAVSAAHILVNMSPRETFCYSFAEGVMRGALPIALRNSAQSELIPSSLRPQLSVSASLADIATTIDKQFTTRYDQYRDEVREYLRARTAPTAYVRAYEGLLARLRPRARPTVTKARFTSADVTVLIPAHNPDRHLLETIESVRAQSRAPKKIIIGSDGTTQPEARELLSELEALPGIHIADFDWSGLAETRNRLLKLCDTELFAFVDADDVLMPRFIETSIDYLAANYDEGVRSVQGWYELFGSQAGFRGPVVYQHFSHSLWNDLKNNHMGVTQVFRDLRYNSNLIGGEAEDWELWLRYFQSGWEIRVIPEVLWRYRRHPGALSSRWSEAMSVGTARANAIVLRSSINQRRADHVWEFVGEYMYLGETFYNSLSNARSEAPRPIKAHRSLGKLERRLINFQAKGTEPTFRQEIAIRLMRSLAKTLK